MWSQLLGPKEDEKGGPPLPFDQALKREAINSRVSHIINEQRLAKIAMNASYSLAPPPSP